MKKIIYIDMDGVLVDVDSGFMRLDEKTREEYKDFPYNAPGVFPLMDPMPGAIDAFIRLSKEYDVFILSAPPWNNPQAWTDKVLWVKRFLPQELIERRLIMSHHKNLNKGDYIIDDRLLKGVDRFEGEHIHFGSDRFPHWQAVLEYLLPEDKQD